MNRNQKTILAVCKREQVHPNDCERVGIIDALAYLRAHSVPNADIDAMARDIAAGRMLTPRLTAIAVVYRLAKQCAVTLPQGMAPNERFDYIDAYVRAHTGTTVA